MNVETKTANEKAWVTADGDRLVKDNDPEASVLLARMGQKVPVQTLERYSNADEFFIANEDFVLPAESIGQVRVMSTTAIMDPNVHSEVLPAPQEGALPATGGDFGPRVPETGSLVKIDRSQTEGQASGSTPSPSPDAVAGTTTDQTPNAKAEKVMTARATKVATAKKGARRT